MDSKVQLENTNMVLKMVNGYGGTILEKYGERGILSQDQ
jgi:hypothetical protein